MNPDGSADASFDDISYGGNHLFVTFTKGLVLPDGKILAGVRSQFGTTDLNLWRYNVDGTRDMTFESPTFSSGFDINDMSLYPDGKIMVSGAFQNINSTNRKHLVRLFPAGNVYLDGRTDFAIFRPSNGYWWSLSSLNGNQVAANWGQAGDIPRPSDFDGDGRADYILFRPSNSSWYRGSSANGSGSIQNFGLAGDKPVTGDFDGDGKSDKAIFRPSTGDWWWQSSLDNAQRATHWGADTDIPAPADYDGDGKTDFAVYRPSNGAWYVVNSGNGSFTILSFGIAEDKPVPADYDGDGKADIAVFRPSNGAWYLLRSADGFFALSFGVSTDIPVENAFVP